MKTKLFYPLANGLFILFVLSNITFAQEVLTVVGKSNFEKLQAGTELKVALLVNINSEWHINSGKPNDEYLIPTTIGINSENNLKLEKIIFPEAENINLAFSEEPVSVFQGSVKFFGLIKVPRDFKPGEYKFEVTFNYQACNNQSCLPPKSVKIPFKFKVVDSKTPILQINSELFEGVKFSEPKVEKKSSESSLIDEGNLFLSFILIFLSGLALNLTPCVYPLIPITVGFFGGQSESKISKLFLLSGLYVLGIAITYSTIGVVTALSGSLFGALLQNPFVLIFIALVLVTLSLSMFGLYELQLPNSIVTKYGGAKSGLFGALFMGLTMGIVAAPCIGPFIIGLLAFVGAKGDVLLGFSMFFTLAIGLGTPYLFLGVLSGKIKNLPKSGEWMVAVKKIFGFVLIGMAIYFLLPLIPKDVRDLVLPIFMILSAIYLLLFDKLGLSVKGFRNFKFVFLSIVILFGAWFLVPNKSNSIEWTPLTSQEVNLVGQPTIIDFYADWCIPCKELDALTFSNEEVINESKRFRNFKVDLTNSSDGNIATIMKKFNIIGVPTVILFDSKGNEVNRITSFVEAEVFLKAMKEVN